jgi:tetratricopeptide (TPR) repeat protein
MRPDLSVGLPVARYLRPEEAVVPFRPRPELDELLAWCASAEHAAVRLVTGEGGSGKTRLALRLGEELEENGWLPLWVKRGAEDEAVGAVREIGQRCVLVVDYAETRSDLTDLLDDVAADEDGPELRVVLLARSAGEWWEQLLANAEEQTAELLEADSLISLGPVRAAGGAHEVFAEAVTAFAQRLGTRRPEAEMVLSDADPVVLVVHATALLAVVDYVTGVPPRHQAVSGHEVLGALLRHEARYWARSAASRGLDLDLSVLRLAAAAGCLIGAENETAAGMLLARIPDLDSAEHRGRAARWLHDLYPAPHEVDAEQHEWLGPLRPDRLAEQFVADELTRHPELIPPLFTGLTEYRAERALTVLARAAMTQDRVVSLLRVALAADLDHLAVPALLVAVETNPVLGELLAQVISGQPVSLETLEQIAEQSPYPSLALAAPVAVALRRLADATDDDEERAGWLYDLSARLGELGRQKKALATMEEAVSIYWQLAEADPDGWLPALANALNSLAGRFAALGRRKKALTVIKQAVTIRRHLAEEDPDEFFPDLASSLNNLSNCLGDLGRLEEALVAIEEAIFIRRVLAEISPEEFIPAVASSLNNLSNCLGALGRQKEAIAAIKEAVAIHRLLADDSSDAFLPDLAMSLNNQAVRLEAIGRREGALAAMEEAVSIYRRLAEARPAAFLPDLGRSLKNLADILASLNRDADASAIREEANSIVDARSAIQAGR